jgi:hypothetical protein
LTGATLSDIGPPLKIQELPRFRARFHDGRKTSENPEIPHNRTSKWQRNGNGVQRGFSTG